MSLTNLIKTKLTSLSARAMKVRPARLSGPVASVTFDDFPKSAWTVGGEVLARHGARGTYYTAGGFCGRIADGTVFYDEADLEALASQGHEIGCHGFGHQPTPNLTTQELQADNERNREFLKPFLNGQAPLSYAFPFGRVSPRTKRFFARRFSSIRGVHPGINAGRVDLAQLNTVSLEMRCWDKLAISASIRRAAHDRGWLIFYTHDVSNEPSEYGSTPEMLDWALGEVAEANIPVLPVCEALSFALPG
jgi:peptidoglycan/xylan/chitin deacetylase (PgdA/CDA1 family)